MPGTFSLTNKMLSNLRAAEKYVGRKPADWRDLFAEETQAIRLAVKGAARRASIGCVCADGAWNVHVGVFGHWKHDPDSWLLLGKAAVDGLVTAGVMSSDRFNLWELSGRTYRGKEEERVARISAGCAVGVQGALLTLTEVAP
jgi:hypothetical protein